MTELKACPFCRGKVYWCGDEPGAEDPHHDCDQITCPTCKFNLDVHGDTVRDCEDFAQARAAVAAIWNQRTPTAGRECSVPEGQELEPEVERDWQEFWLGVVAPNGIVDMQQVKRELFDFHCLMDNATKVYCHATGKRISKLGTDSSVVCMEIDNVINERIEEALEDERDAASTSIQEGAGTSFSSSSGLIESTASEWRPIKTAPEDGTEVLVYVPDSEEQFVAYFSDFRWTYALVGSMPVCLDGPTHWMPLPSPPSKEQSNG